MNLAEIASQKADVAGLVGGARSGLELPEISPARGAKGTGDGMASSAKTDVAFGKSKRRTSIYDHVDHDTESGINPWSRGYIGIIANYFSVGLLHGGSTSILYPILVVREGSRPSLVTAAMSLVRICWSWKILFGFISDCFPICGWKRKPYICLGWTICALTLLELARQGNNVVPQNLILLLTAANCAYVCADVSADGFMVFIAQREKLEERGRMQTLIYTVNSFGQIVVNMFILLGFSGPATNCPGYEPNLTIPCTMNPDITSRNDMFLVNPDDWCHLKCRNATFSFDISIPIFAMTLAAVNILSLPLFATINEDKVPYEFVGRFLRAFWKQVQRRATWQILLYSMVSNITFGVENAAKLSANFVWLNLRTSQFQIMVLFEKLLFFFGLIFIRRYALNTSWRVMILCGSLMILFFNSLYYLIVFDVWRNPWFYIFTDVTSTFMWTVNFVASVASMVEVAEPGYESITYALITTAANVVSPLSSVVSYQLLSFFPSLTGQESIATDTPLVRSEFATLHSIVIIINLTSLLSLPLLPRQKRETRELLALGEKSKFWSAFALVSGLTFLLYSTVITYVTVALHDVYGCFRVLGGTGCSADESSGPAHFLVASVLLYCYIINFSLSFLPILKGRKKFSWRELFL